MTYRPHLISCALARSASSTRRRVPAPSTRAVLLAALAAWPLAFGCSSTAPPPSPSPPSSQTHHDAGSDHPADASSPSTNQDAADQTPDASAGQDDAAATDDSAPSSDVASADDSAPPSGGGNALETVQVPASGDAVALKTTLDKGELFLLRAAGTIDLGATKMDAEYGFAADGTGAMDMVGGADVGVDTGFLAVTLANQGGAPPKMGPGRQKWFGAFQADHVYYAVVTGTGAAPSIKVTKPAGATGTGSIAVSVYRLTPTAAGIGDPLENDMVPFTKATEDGMMTLAAGKTYLLGAAGEAQVGGPGSNGDAEFDDYGPDGKGYNEGEGKADFGICVDEACMVKRVHKWGAYRNDHSYYMLYAGTGMPIKYAYCDTGYPDNAGGMTVKVYAAP